MLHCATVCSGSSGNVAACGGGAAVSATSSLAAEVMARAFCLEAPLAFTVGSSKVSSGALQKIHSLCCDESD